MSRLFWDFMAFVFIVAMSGVIACIIKLIQDVFKED